MSLGISTLDMNDHSALVIGYISIGYKFPLDISAIDINSHWVYNGHGVYQNLTRIVTGYIIVEYKWSLAISGLNIDSYLVYQL